MKQMLGRVLGSSYDDDGFLGVQIEVFGTQGVGWFELSNPHGFQSRPLDPDTDGACQAYYWYDGARGYATLANDPRTQALLPSSQKGEMFLHGPLGNFIRCHADGKISLFTTDDGTTAGRSVFLQLSRTGLVFNFPFGRLTFDDTGFHVLHNSGARIDLGAVGGLPAPLDGLQSYASMGAAMARLEGSAVSLGTRAGAAEPMAKAVATLTALQAIQTAQDAVAAAMTGLLTVPIIAALPSASGPIAAAVTAIAVAQAAIASAALTIPSLATAST